MTDTLNNVFIKGIFEPQGKDAKLNSELKLLGGKYIPAKAKIGDKIIDSMKFMFNSRESATKFMGIAKVFNYEVLSLDSELLDSVTDSTAKIMGKIKVASITLNDYAQMVLYEWNLEHNKPVPEDIVDDYFWDEVFPSLSKEEQDAIESSGEVSLKKYLKGAIEYNFNKMRKQNRDVYDWGEVFRDWYWYEVKGKYNKLNDAVKAFKQDTEFLKIYNLKGI